MALRWTNLDDLIARLGPSYVATDANSVALQQILSGVEVLIQNAIRSPVKLELKTDWTAPVCDPRLMTKWRPINTVSEANGTDNPIALVCTQAFQASTGTALTYGTNFVIYGIGSDETDTRALEPMLEAIGGAWWGWGGNQSWGGSWVRPPTRLANTLTSDRGRIRVTYWAGWPATEIPAVLFDAAYLEAATQWSVRQTGRLLSSESLNGYSYQTAPVSPPTGATVTTFASPIARDMLQQYILPAIAGVGPW